MHLEILTDIESCTLSNAIAESEANVSRGVI